MLDQLRHQFLEGGWAMWLILFWLLSSLAVVLERCVYLFSSHQNIEVLTATVLKNILADDIPRAINLAKRAHTPLGNIVSAGLEKCDNLPKEVQAALDETALIELPNIGKRIGYLALFANLSMLCGLFGTIVGLIKAFGVVGSGSIDPASKARLLAEGIGEAMNCTAFGLLVAILSVAAYAFLNNWARNQEEGIHLVTVKVYNALVDRQRGRHL